MQTKWKKNMKGKQILDFIANEIQSTLNCYENLSKDSVSVSLENDRIYFRAENYEYSQQVDAFQTALVNNVEVVGEDAMKLNIAVALDEINWMKEEE